MKIGRILLMTVLMAGNAFAGRSATIDVKATLDSAYIIMGNQTRLNVEVVGDLGDNGEIVFVDSLWKDVEVASKGTPEIKDLGNGRKLLRQEVTIQSFDSGLYTLPPLVYLQGNETIESNRCVLKVIPVNVDSMQTVHDYADALKGKHRLFDFLPDWISDYGLWILLAIAGIALGLYLYLRYRKKGSILPVPQAKPIPPYELAIHQLETLKNEKLCERGEEKEFYTRLTDILRTYLDTRFGINAMEMTSTQILRALNSNEETRMPRKYMSRILEIADFVKFAKVRPLPDDNVQAFKSAMQFVEDTKPATEPVETADNATDNNENPTNKKD